MIRIISFVVVVNQTHSAPTFGFNEHPFRVMLNPCIDSAQTRAPLPHFNRVKMCKIAV